MITPDGWFDWAVRDHGSLDRIAYMGSRPSDMDTAVFHSLEGWFYPVSGTTGYNAARDPARYPTLWHGSNTSLDTLFKGRVYPPGTLFQHAPVQARLVHAHAANSRGPGFEHEGVAGQPLIPAQIATALRIIADLRAFTGRPFLRVPGSGRGLVEHREVGPTACPSSRMIGLWQAVNEEDDVGMTPEEAQRLRVLEDIVAGFGINLFETDENGNPKPLVTGAEALAIAHGRQWSAFLGIGEARQKIALHEQNHPGPTKIPEHDHEPSPVRQP